MKIALVGASFGGGIETALCELALALKNAGHDVLVLGGCEDQSASGYSCPNGVGIHRLFMDESAYPYLFQFWPATKLIPYAWHRSYYLSALCAPILDNFKPDVLDSSGLGGALFWALEGRYPLVTRIHGLVSVEYEVEPANSQSQFDIHLATALETITFLCSDALTTPSHALAGLVHSRCGIPREEVEVISNPLSRHAASPDASFEQIKRGRPLLLHYGRLVHGKGCDLIAEALPAVARVYPGVRLLIAGGKEFKVNKASFSEILKSRIAALGLEDHVQFLGVVPRENIKGLVELADICIFPSRFENAPYACAEAMSFGATVIATDVGGVPELIEHSQTGWLVPVEDSQALSDAICRLMSDEGLRRGIGERAREAVFAKLDEQRIVRSAEALYERAIRRFQNRPASRGDAARNVLNDINAAFLTFSTTNYLDERIAEVYSEGARAGWAEADKTNEARLAEAREEAYRQGFMDRRVHAGSRLRSGLSRAVKQLARTLSLSRK